MAIFMFTPLIQSITQPSATRLLAIFITLIFTVAMGLGAGSVQAAGAKTAKFAKSAKSGKAAKSAKSSKAHVAKNKSKLQSKAHSRSSMLAKKSSARGHSRLGARAKFQRVVVRGKNGRRMVVLRRVSAPLVAAEPPKPSYGQLAGLHATQDPLELRSSVAYVMDQDTQEILVHKNENAVLPIASLTKLMTGIIISEAQLDMQEIIMITEADVDNEKGSRSRLKVGTALPRGELMLLALMSSENRAAHALGRSFPGGMERFVSAMNAKARMLGLSDTRYVEPTGLSSGNQSSAKDLAALTAYASNDKTLRELSTTQGHQVYVGERLTNFVNTNRLVRNPEWEIGLQKTGFISEAGQCLVMQTKVAGRRLIMVFLDSVGRLSRLGDAERVRRWVEGAPLPAKIG